ncbi:MAG: hypothetical protein CTY30_00515 [Methylocystis sp.]|nr:MAG: hypothetical protein CTY30_00515 [Methylocystis sp.]
MHQIIAAETTRRGKRATDVETAWDGPRECCVRRPCFRRNFARRNDRLMTPMRQDGRATCSSKKAQKKTGRRVVASRFDVMWPLREGAAATSFRQ